MGRAFDFRSSSVREARARQKSLCAVCGENLDDLEEHAHHVVPNQSGDKANPAHAWLASKDNCAILCATCHVRVHHDGRFRRGAVAPARYFVHSHGRSKGMHQSWVRQLEQRAKQLWAKG